MSVLHQLPVRSYLSAFVPGDGSNCRGCQAVIGRVSALDETDSAAVRLQPHPRPQSREADFSIHDLSRVELDMQLWPAALQHAVGVGGGPGVAPCACPSRHRRRRVLVLDAMLHRYDQTLSDISGMDIEAHGNEPGRVIAAVRDWLNGGRGDGPPLPGSAAIVADYAALQVIADGLIARLALGPFDRLPHAGLPVRQSRPPCNADRGCNDDRRAARAYSTQLSGVSLETGLPMARVVSSSAPVTGREGGGGRDELPRRPDAPRTPGPSVID